MSLPPCCVWYRFIVKATYCLKGIHETCCWKVFIENNLHECQFSLTDKVCVNAWGFIKGPGTSKLTRVWGWFCMPGFTILIKRFSLNSFAHLWKPVASLLKASTKPMVKTFSMYYIFYKETTDRMTAWHALKLTNPKIHDWKCSFGIQGSQESSAHPRKKTCRIYSMGTCQYSGNNMTSSGQLAPNHLSLVC